MSTANRTTPNLTYLVGIDAQTDLYTCTCPDHIYRHRDCKHIKRVQAQTRPAVQRARVSDAGRALATALEV
jgi:hypothetical protein